ncbi:MAG: potassium transporter TrkG, partial [Pseudoclavibacter sp.]
MRRPGRRSSTGFARIRDWIDDIAHSSPSRFAVVIFTGIIFLWTFLLSLPISSASGQVTPFYEALFTAVSTICVSGLVVVDMGSHWSVFGNVLIFLGMQVGAVGVLTLASVMGLVVTRRLGLRQRLMVASDQNPLRTHAGAVSESQAVRLGEIGGVIATVAISLVVIEFAIALLILPVFLTAGDDVFYAIYESFYYATSAFTNTGFTPNSDGLAPWSDNVWLLTCLGVAVFLGSLGFPVIFALA